MLRANFGIYFSTLQVEEACLDEDDPAGAIDILKSGHAERAARAESEVLKTEGLEP